MGLDKFISFSAFDRLRAFRATSTYYPLFSAFIDAMCRLFYTLRWGKLFYWLNRLGPFGEGNMKVGVTLSKIVSTSVALILCSAVLGFALTALCWGAALPAHAASPSISSNPLQVSAGNQMTVN